MVTFQSRVRGVGCLAEEQVQNGKGEPGGPCRGRAPSAAVSLSEDPQLQQPVWL